MNSKQYTKVSLNQEMKTIRITKQIFNTKSEGLSTLGTTKNFQILNQKGIDKLIDEGWKVVDGITKVTNNITSEWQPQYLVGGKIEEEIAAYVNSKLKRQGVQFIKDLHIINEKSKVTAKELFGETKFEKVQPLTFHKAYDKFERTELGRERKFQMMEVEV